MPGSPSAAKIHSLIRDEGRITFARFMEIALYDPDGGYYMQRGRVGERGDFYTSPSVHPAFGALLCVQLREMWQRLGSPGEFAVIELGAGAGLLSDDIAAYAPALDDRFAGALKLYPVDRGSPHEPELPAGVPGCVVSNELLDAFPVHRFTIVDGDLRELWVTERDGRLVEEPGELSDARIAERLSSERRFMADGCVGEVCLELDAWALGVARALSEGFVITIDYGYPRALLYAEERRSGTLRCYYRHTLNANAFQHIGEQDLSVHVDFDAVDEALAACGFRQAGCATQASFLSRLGLDHTLTGPPPPVPRHQLEADRAALRKLFAPDGFGTFTVMIHAKGVRAGRLSGLSGEAQQGSPPPLPHLDDDPRRVHLTGGYPRSTEFTATWEELLGGQVPEDQ